MSQLVVIRFFLRHAIFKVSVVFFLFNFRRIKLSVLCSNFKPMSRCRIAWKSCLQDVSHLQPYSLMDMNRSLLTSSYPKSVHDYSTPGSPWTHPSPMSESDEDPPQTTEDHCTAASLPTSMGESICPELIIIDTHFDPKLRCHEHYPCRRLSKDQVFHWTEKERSKAEKAIIPQNFESLQMLVSSSTNLESIGNDNYWTIAQDAIRKT